MRVELKTLSLRCAKRSAMLAMAASLASSPSAIAQNAKVYVANSATTSVLEVEFDPISTSTVINDVGLLTQVRDIALRDDGLAGMSLILCDRNTGRIAFHANSAGPGQIIFDAGAMPGPKNPDGMSLDAAGNIFVLRSAPAAAGQNSQVWVIRRDPDCPGGPECLAGGYAAPLGFIDPKIMIATLINNAPANLRSGSAVESLVGRSTSGILQAGDLLVLVTPGALVRYHAADVQAFLAAMALGQTPAPLVPDTIIHPAIASVAASRKFPAGAVPSAMAFGPNGELLIAVSDGRVLIYDSDGHRRSNGNGFVDFTSGAGSGDFKIAVGLQDGTNRALISHQQAGVLRRYSFTPDGTGSLDAVVSGFQTPVGVESSNSSTSSAPPGEDVTVSPTTVMTTQIEKVITAGDVNAKVTTFPDPREKEQSIPPNLPLHRSLYLNELRADLPAIEIPAWARAFRLGDQETGVPSFILIEVQSNGNFFGVLDHLVEETPILGYDPDCNDEDLTRQPFLFWAPDANDPPIVEGARFIDVSTGCGSIRGMTRAMSYFLAGVRVTEPMRDLVGQKLWGLRTFIDTDLCINDPAANRLLPIVDHAQAEFDANNYGNVIEVLEELEAEVISNPIGLDSCFPVTNTVAEIRARVRSAIFVLPKVE